MATTAVDTVIDVAFWFMDKARSEDVYLQPQKLQRLLYLSQGHYAQAYHGRRLMPAIFQVFQAGPVEPNTYRIMEAGRPDIRVASLPPEVANFLERIWLRYGHHGTDHLNQEVKAHEIVWRILRKGEGEEIPFSLMAAFFQQLGSTPRRRTIKTPDGRRLQKWVPSGRPVARTPAPTPTTRA